MFRQLDVNLSLEDRFATSWSMHRGCHFYLWERLRPGEYFEGQKFQEHGMHDQGYNDFEDHGNTVMCFPAFLRCCGADSVRVRAFPTKINLTTSI